MFYPGLTAEWLRFPSGDWRDLDGWEWSSDSGAAEVERLEASFYTVEHDPVTSCRIRLRATGGTAFMIDWDATIDYPGFASGEEEPAMHVRASALGEFRGVMLDNSIVKPQARFREHAAALFAEHLRLDRFSGGVQLRTGEFGGEAWWLLA